MIKRNNITRRLLESPSTLSNKQIRNARYNTKKAIRRNVEFLSTILSSDNSTMSEFVLAELARTGICNKPQNIKMDDNTIETSQSDEFWDD